MNGDIIIRSVILIFSFLMAAVFVLSGIGKMTGFGQPIQLYLNLGIPFWAICIVGFLECVGGSLLVISRFFKWGVLLLFFIILVDGYVQFTHDNASMVFRALVVMLMLMTVYVLKMKQPDLDSPSESDEISEHS